MRAHPPLRLSIIAAAFALGGCAELGYYAQAVNGQLWVLSARRPIDIVLADPDLAPARREKLTIAARARDFAVRELALPDNGSYRQFADLGRGYAVWNVVATPALSLRPRQSCFPVAGCLAYRGYYSRERAEAYADARRDAGDDVLSGPVDAYSTLGWFDDPLLNTMLDGDPPEMVAIVFHELAHQRVYATGDSVFNESYATAVEIEGMRRWLAGDAEFAAWQTRRDRERRVRALLRDTRDALARVYGSDRGDAAKRVAKRDLFDAARARYRALRDAEAWGRRYDGWFGERLNNALLAVLDTYHRWVSAFQARLAALQGDFARFHAEVEVLAALPRPEREARLRQWCGAACDRGPDGAAPVAGDDRR